MAKQPPVTWQTAPVAVKVIAVLMVAVPLLLVVTIVRSCSNRPERTYTLSEKLESRAKGHLTEAREAVKKRLNHPKTADFSIMSESFYVFDTINAKVRLTGTVSAKNSFGVEDDVNYMVILHVPTPEEYSIESVDLFK